MAIGTVIIQAIIFFFIKPVAPTLNRMVTQDEGASPTKSRDHVTNKKRYISIFIRTMDPKLRRVVT